MNQGHEQRDKYWFLAGVNEDRLLKKEKESLPVHTQGYYELEIQSIPPTTFISLQICLKIELSSSTVHSSLCQER